MKYPFEEGRNEHPAPQTQKGRPMTTSTYQEDPFLSARLAEFESQDAMLNPFRQCIEELEEEVDRAKRDGVCSGEVAKAARQAIKELTSEMECLILKKI